MLSISKRTLFILTSLAPLASAAPTLQIEATGTAELTLRGKDAKQLYSFGIVAAQSFGRIETGRCPSDEEPFVHC